MKDADSRSSAASVEALEAARKSIMAAGIGSCDCNTKSPNAAYHAGHCRYLKILSALDSLEIVEDGLRSSGVAQAAPVPTLVKGTVYHLGRFGPAEYLGIDVFHGQTSHHFRTSNGPRYILPEHLASALSSTEGK